MSASTRSPRFSDNIVVSLSLVQPANDADANIDIAQVTKTMQLFVKDEMNSMGLDFSVWDWSREDHFGMYLGMFVKFGVVRDSKTLQLLFEFACEIAKNYLDNPYHSFFHAMDMTYMTYYLINDMGIREQLELSLAEATALLLSALGHDVLHPGTNNLYQVNAKTNVAKTYHNQSVLENQSLSFVRTLLCSPRFVPLMNGFQFDDSDAPKQDTVNKMLDIISDSILKTDMMYHFTLLEQLATFAEENEQILTSHISLISSSIPTVDNDVHKSGKVRQASESSWSNGGGANLPAGTDVSPTTNADHTDGSESPASLGAADKERPTVVTLSSKSSFVVQNLQGGKFKIANSTDFLRLNSVSSMLSEMSLEVLPKIPIKDAKTRQTMLNVILHAADISNPARPPKVCQKWSDLVTQEFFNQGELERQNNLPISPNMDRETTNQIQIQIAFMDFIVRPYFESLAEVFPRMVSFADIIHENARHWANILPPSPVPSKTESDGDTQSQITASPINLTATPLSASMSSPPSIGSGPSSAHSKRKISLEQEIARKNAPLHNTFHSFQSSHGHTRSMSGGTSGGTQTIVNNFASGRRLSMAAGTVEIPETVDRLFNRLRARASNGNVGLSSINSSQNLSQSAVSSNTFSKNLKSATGTSQASGASSPMGFNSIASRQTSIRNESYSSMSALAGTGSYSSQTFDERDEFESGSDENVTGNKPRHSTGEQQSNPSSATGSNFPGISTNAESPSLGSGPEMSRTSTHQRVVMSLFEKDKNGVSGSMPLKAPPPPRTNPESKTPTSNSSAPSSPSNQSSSDHKSRGSKNQESK